MTLPDILLNKDDFGNSKWFEVIRDVEEKECLTYNGIFSKKAQESREQGIEKDAAVFSFLSAVTSFHFTPESATEPFAPLFQMHGSRGIIPSDFTDNNIESLKVVFDLISDPELKARISDVLWLTRHDHKKAEAAIEAYLESAKTLEDPEMWPPAADRIERALRLSISLQNNPWFDKVVSHIEETIKKYNGTDPKFFTSKLMKLLLEVKRGNPEQYIPIASKIAENSLAQHDWEKARTYLEIKSRWYALAKSEPERLSALIEEAEVYVKEADATLSSGQPSYFAASIHLQKAIEALRRIGGQQQRVDELHRQLLVHQKKVPNELHEISHEMDLTALVEPAIERVKNKTFNEAIRALALSCRPPQIKRLEERVKQIMAKSPLQFIVSRSGINAEGKVVSRRPALDLSGSEEDNQNALRAAMYEQATTIDSCVNTYGVIEPSRKQIAYDHSGSPEQFFVLVRNNPFVPEDRESLYARALSAGLRGDMVEFLGIAIPQFENSIRYIVSQNGIPASGIDEEGIQKEYDLNKLLFMPEIKKILGEDLVFDLQGLLVVHGGANLRNRFAHGLIDHDGFYSAHVVYFWWLLLRILILGTMINTAPKPTI